MANELNFKVYILELHIYYFLAPKYVLSPT